MKKRKSSTIQVRVTVEEKEALQKAAMTYGMTVSQFVRYCALYLPKAKSYGAETQ